MTRAHQRIYRTLIEPLERHHRRSLDNLLNVAPDLNITWRVWLRQSPLKPNSRYGAPGPEKAPVVDLLDFLGAICTTLVRDDRRIGRFTAMQRPTTTLLSERSALSLRELLVPVSAMELMRMLPMLCQALNMAWTNRRILDC